jgi:hypothetical protein
MVGPRDRPRKPSRRTGRRRCAGRAIGRGRRPKKREDGGLAGGWRTGGPPETDRNRAGDGRSGTVGVRVAAEVGEVSARGAGGKRPSPAVLYRLPAARRRPGDGRASVRRRGDVIRTPAVALKTDSGEAGAWRPGGMRAVSGVSKAGREGRVEDGSPQPCAIGRRRPMSSRRRPGSSSRGVAPLIRTPAVAPIKDSAWERDLGRSRRFSCGIHPEALAAPPTSSRRRP